MVIIITAQHTCVLSEEEPDLADHRVSRESHQREGLLLVKEVVVQVEQSEVAFGDELRVKGRELRDPVVQVETPDVQVSLEGVWPQCCLQLVGGG